LFISGVTCGYSQTELSFTAGYPDKYYPLDSIIIENISNGSKEVKYYPDTLLQLLTTDLNELAVNYSHLQIRNYPNPFADKTSLDIYIPENDLLSIRIYSLSGKLLINFEKELPAGDHLFEFTGNNETFYILSVKTNKYSESRKIVKHGDSNNSRLNLEYNGYRSGNSNPGSKGHDFIYNPGDNLKYTGFITNAKGVVLSNVINDNPSESKKYAFRFEKTNRIIVLMYHKIVSGEPENEYERNVIEFENDLKYLRNNNYQILSAEDLIRIDAGEPVLLSDGIVITFDDGFNSDYSTAYPLLSQYKIPAVFFIVAEWIGTAGYMTWDEVWLISQYHDNDGKKLFDIGSHTSSHPYLEQSEPLFTTRQDYLNFLNTELEDSKNWITDVTGQTNIFLSLPFGDGANNSDIIQTAMKNGYKGIRTSVWNSLTVEDLNLFSIPSLPVLSATSINIIKNYLNY